MFAFDYPVLNGGPVTPAHEDYCRDYGHAYSVSGGVDTDICPRCGAVATNEAPEDAELPSLSVQLQDLDNLAAETARDQLQSLGQHDEDSAHSAMDDLMVRALQAIADGHPDPAWLARQVLIVNKAKFSRYYS